MFFGGFQLFMYSSEGKSAFRKQRFRKLTPTKQIFKHLQQADFGDLPSRSVRKFNNLQKYKTVRVDKQPSRLRRKRPFTKRPLYIRKTRQSSQSQSLNVDVVEYSSTVVSLVWDPAPLDGRVRYQIWFWIDGQSHSDEKVNMEYTYDHKISLTHLVPGELYNIWLMGIHGNQSYDYLTFQQRTGCDKFIPK